MNVVRVHHCSHLDSYAVPSQETPHLVHIVEHVPDRTYGGYQGTIAGGTLPGEWRCGCQWGSSGRKCAHILAVEAFEQHEDEAYERHAEEVIE